MVPLVLNVRPKHQLITNFIQLLSYEYIHHAYKQTKFLNQGFLIKIITRVEYSYNDEIIKGIWNSRLYE